MTFRETTTRETATEVMPTTLASEEEPEVQVLVEHEAEEPQAVSEEALTPLPGFNLVRR